MGQHIMYRDRSDEEFVASVERHVEAINRAVREIPADKVRMHLCWGNYEGPHHLDIELGSIIDAVLRAKPDTILFEAANPRHAHEFVVWRDASIPADKVLVPGVIDSTTNYIEHPELVASSKLPVRRHRRPRARDRRNRLRLRDLVGVRRHRSRHLLGQAALAAQGAEIAIERAG